MARHRARRQALQLLFQWDLRRTPVEEILHGYYGSLLISEDGSEDPTPDEFTEEIFRGVIAGQSAIDDQITRHASHWRIERMPAVDRNILRLAVYELMRTQTPPAVVIDEALELAHQFSGDESAHFVNGVLDAVRRELHPAAAASSPAVP